MAGEEDDTDESVPLSPITAESHLPSAEDLADVDPFTYKPPFNCCDKILVSTSAKNGGGGSWAIS